MHAEIRMAQDPLFSCQSRIKGSIGPGLQPGSDQQHVMHGALQHCSQQQRAKMLLLMVTSLSCHLLWRGPVMQGSHSLEKAPHAARSTSQSCPVPHIHLWEPVETATQIRHTSHISQAGAMLGAGHLLVFIHWGNSIQRHSFLHHRQMWTCILSVASSPDPVTLFCLDLSSHTQF